MVARWEQAWANLFQLAQAKGSLLIGCLLASIMADWLLAVGSIWHRLGSSNHGWVSWPLPSPIGSSKIWIDRRFRATVGFASSRSVKTRRDRR